MSLTHALSFKGFLLEKKTGTNRKQELDEQPISNNQLFAKLCEVEKLLSTPKVEKGLWTIQDIADYMGFSYGYVFKNIISAPRFPVPIDIKSQTKNLTPPLIPTFNYCCHFIPHLV